MNKPESLGHPDFPTDESLSILESDAPSEIRREAMSSIGRKRDPLLKSVLLKYARDPNPEVAMQAIRGLLVFKREPAMLRELETLCDHPNEMIREVVQWEVNGSSEPDEVEHATSLEILRNLVVEGDVLNILDSVPDRSIHLTFTSPPYYNARDYSTYSSYKEYLDFLDEVFKKVLRVTKEGRFFILNTSPIIIPRAGRKYSSRRYPVPFDLHHHLMAMGWEFIDDIVWAKPVESSKNRVAGFEVNRKPLTYKSNARTEYVMVYRKKSQKLIDWNLRQYPQETIVKSKVNEDFERSNVWNIAPSSDRVHSAVFPLELCDSIVKLYSFVGDLVFDPFAGSGTFGKAALMRERSFFLSELSPTYVSRIRQNLNSHSLWTDSPIRFLREESFRQEMEALCRSP